MTIASTHIGQEDESSGLLISGLLRDDPKARYGKEEAYDWKNNRILREPAEQDLRYVSLRRFANPRSQSVHGHGYGCAETVEAAFA
jgi:hypothetical protein